MKCSMASGFSVALALMVSGCNSSPPLPKTYPTKGTILREGGKALDGGVVHFTAIPQLDPLLRVSGEIKEDGTFVLRTMKDQLKEPGAPAGEYTVVIQLPLEEVMISGRKIKHKGVPPIALTQIYTVEPKENELRIEIPATPPE